MVTIPDEASATYLSQSAVDPTDISALDRGFWPSGIVSGLGVTPTGGVMSVTVASGQYVFQGSLASAAGGVVTVPTASSTDRKDLLVLNNLTGTATIIQGTASAATVNGVTPVGQRDPEKPISALSTLLAEIYVKAGATAIVAGDITPKNVTFMAPRQLQPAGTDYATVPPAGWYYFNTTSLDFRVSTGSAWVYVEQDSVAAVGSRLYIVGDSYTAGGGASDPDRQWATLLAGMVRSDLVDIGVGGAQAGDDDMSAPGVIASTGFASWGGWAQVLQAYQPSRAGAPYTPVGITPIICYGHNDVTQHKADASGTPRNVFKEAMRTMMSRLASARIYDPDDAAFAYGGTGTWPASIQNSGGFPRHFNGSGVKRRPLPVSGTMTITWTVPSDIEASSYVGFLYVVPPGAAGSVAFTGTASPVASGGANFGLTKSLSGLAYAANGNTGGTTRDSAIGVTIRVGPFVASDAGKSVIMTITGATTTAIATPGQPGALTGAATTGGAVTYTYSWIEGNENGWSALSTSRSTAATGTAPLTATNSITAPALGAFPTGVRWRALVRTAGGTVNNVVVAVITSNVAVTDTSPYGLFPVPSGVATGLGIGRQGPSFNGCQIETVSPVTKGIVCNIPRKTTYANSVTDTDIANYNTDIASVIAEFPTGQWVVGDLDATLAKNSAYFASDGVHPNDRGHARIAAALYPLVRGLTAGDQVSAALQSQVMKRVSAEVVVTRRFGAVTDARDYLIGTAAPAVIDPNNNLFFMLNAEVGDDIEVGLNGVFSSEAAGCMLDFAVVDSSLTVIRYLHANSYWSPTTWTGSSTIWSTISTLTNLNPVTGSFIHTVQPGDLSTFNTIPGIIAFQLWGKASTASKTLYGGGSAFSPPLQIFGRNLSRRNNGSNTS